MTEPDATSLPSPRPHLSVLAQLWLWPLGVLLPAVTLVHELTYGWCAEALFEPLPGPLHVVLVAMVPLANLAVLLSLVRRAGPRFPRLLRFANGLALGVAVYYSLVFAPLMPISVMAILAWGLGLLSLSPSLALLASLDLGRRLRRRTIAPEHDGTDRPPSLRYSPAPAPAGPKPGRAGLWGAFTAILLLVAAGALGVYTRYQLHRSVTAGTAERSVALARLRLLGDREVLLRACYQRSGQMSDLATWLLGLRDIDPEAAREVYYRVTGDPFNSVPPPKLSSLRGDDFDSGWDFDQGGASVGGVLRGLSLASSRLDGSLDPDAAVGYLEWTLELSNQSAVQREARTTLALPPGAVVSRATLWIDGMEREAAFGGRAVTREAYEKVVRARRDPLLVTTAGPDRVLVQCFPVPAGGSMKIRLGITVPLPLLARDHTRLRLPVIAERNFRIDPSLRHAVWLESPRPLAASDTALAADPTPTAAALRGGLDDGELGAVIVTGQRDPSVVTAWARDTSDRSAPDATVVERLVPAPPAAPPRIVVVLDGSRGLAPHLPALAAALSAAVPPPTVLVAGDEVVAASPADLTVDRFRGGTDNLPALAAAWDRAAGTPPGVVIWVHAPQPVLLGSTAELRQRCERRPDGPRIVSLAVAPGPDRVLAELDGCALLAVAANGGDLTADLRGLLAGAPLDGGALRTVRERGVGDGGELRAPGSHETSAHLVRLWARDEVERLRSPATGGREGDVTAATALAVRHQLVTPVSGAVVLETAAQYEEAGLSPGDPSQVPTIPEPETWLLILVAALLALAFAARRRLQGGSWPATGC